MFLTTSRNSGVASARESGQTLRRDTVMECRPLKASETSEIFGGAQKLNGADLAKVAAVAAAENEESKIYVITDIELGVMSAETVQRFAVAQVYSKNNTRGVLGSPDDPRFGVLANDEICSTCHLTTMECPGHFGYIKLNQKFIHPLFMLDAINVLQCVCPSCSRVYIGDINSFEKYHGRERWKKIAEAVRTGNIVCSGNKAQTGKCVSKKCGATPIYSTKDVKDSFKVTFTYKSDKATEYTLSIEEVISIFKCITAEDAAILGFQNGMHPRNLILENLPVLPPCARPFTYVDGKKRESPLTCLYREDIAKHNAAIIESSSTSFERSNNIADLYYKMSRLMDNHDGKLKAPDRAVEGIRQLMGQKGGLVRKSNMGKAVNHCARTVLGPCSILRFGQVSFPDIMRRSLTVQDRVHARNIDYIRYLFDNDEILYYIPDSGLKGQRFAITPRNKERIRNSFQIGDIVDRRLRPETRWFNPKTGKEVILPSDVALFNRQPTLSKHSIQGHELIVSQTRTIGVHMANTKQYNADFDGDEGSLHILQTRGSQAEARTFASTKANMMSGTTNSPFVGIVYNGLTSCYIMTEASTRLTDDEWEEAISTLTYDLDEDFEARLVRHGVEPRSGAALFSTLLPADLWYQKGSVKIVDGVLKSGRIAKAHIGVSGGAIQQSIWKTHGAERAAEFITNCTYLSDWFIYNHGVTVSFGDISLSKQDNAEVRRKIEDKRTEIQIKIADQHQEDMTPLELEYLEKQICSWVNTLNELGGSIAGLLKPNNPFIIMCDSGAKGSKMNTAQIMGTVGQQFIKGERPTPKMADMTRVLPYFLPNNEDIRSKGYCTSSLFMGLTPIELFFHAQATRTNLTDTAVSTAEVGHLHHRLVKVMEDVSSRYDGSVRTADGAVMLTNTGAGYDPAKMVSVHSQRIGTDPLVTFIDLRETIGRLNQKRGFTENFVGGR